MEAPIRQCIVCRQRKTKRSLLRIVRTPRGVEFDSSQKKEGRGYYLCAEQTCLQRAKSSDLISRLCGIKAPESLYIQLAESLMSSHKDSLATILGFAARSRSLVMGMESVTKAAKKGKVWALIVDSHASRSTVSRIEALGRQHGIPLVVYRGRESFDQIVGKHNCRYVGVTAREFASRITSR